MAKRGGYPGMGGGMNMNNMMKQVQKMQKQMEAMKHHTESSLLQQRGRKSFFSL